jgi:hypothetical protein
MCGFLAEFWMSCGSVETQSQLIRASLAEIAFGCRMAFINTAWSVESANFRSGEKS